MSTLLLLGALPFLAILLYYFWSHPKLFFAFIFIVNYFIMGIMRYNITIPMPVTVFMEILWLCLLAFLLGKREEYFQDGKIPYTIFGLYGIWTFYLVLEIINDSCGLGLDLYSWYKDVRPYGFDPLIIMLIYSLIINSKKDVKQYLYLWGGILLVMAFKCYIQRNKGFDSYEMNWLLNGGGKTHFVIGAVRCFSFFSDAANMGSSMAICMVIYGILTFSTAWKRWKEKLFWLVITLASGYCVVQSGTRSAIAVGLAGIFVYIFLSRNWKMFFTSIFALIALAGFLMFTNIGEGNKYVDRMRSTFNPDDASLNVRLENQRAIKSYMAEAPLGIGLGRNQDNVPINNKFHLVATAAPDSSLVYYWMRTGIIGLILFCGVSLAILVGATIIVWFRIHDKELRTIAGAFTAAGAAWLVAGYGNQIYYQFPNSMMVFGMLAIVYLCPYLDRKITTDKEEKEKKLEKLDGASLV